MPLQKVTKGPLERIHKNLYFDTVLGKYFFEVGGERREIASQEALLLVYILEVLNGGRRV